MEGTGEDEVIVDVELVEAVGEVALVDQTAGFVDDYESEDYPAGNEASVSSCSNHGA